MAGRPLAPPPELAFHPSPLATVRGAIAPPRPRLARRQQRASFLCLSTQCGWWIEELFRSLKTGCQFEKLQLESSAALNNAFAVMLPVAVRLLALRDLARTCPDAQASEVLTALQLRVLRVHEHTRKMPLKTAREAMLAVARLGGHIKNNGDPGWLVLGRGYEDLLALEAGARLALEM